MAETLHNLLPSAESAYAMGKMMVFKAQHSKASTFFKQSVELQTDDDAKAEYYLTLANHYFQNLNQPAQARTFAIKATTTKPGWGKPYIAIGNYYAASAKSCGEGNEFKTAAAYWVAVDKYIKAKSIDANVADEANIKIATWSKYFPEKKEAFMYNAIEGESYTVECWINETTTIRVQ
jgi:tetratricopeptide (TPR) repeat protein